MSGDVNLFLSKVRAHFGDPRLAEGVEEKDFYADFIRELSYYSDRCLTLAGQKLVASREKRIFPTLAACIGACREVSMQLAAEGPVQPRKDRNPEWSKEAYAEANRLICSEIGRRAAAEGWIIGLWDFCRENRRWPNNFEAKRVMDKSLSTWRELQFIEDDEATLSNPKQLIKSFKRQRAHLSQIARGRIAA